MPTIDIRRRHHLDMAQARTHVDQLAQRMQEKFGVRTRWDGDTLRLHHAGLEGGITLTGQDIRVQARLGLLLAGFKPRIEQEVREKLEAYFGPEPPP